MKKGLTEMIFILDKSGSMGGLENDTIGGFNAMIEKQKQEPGEAIVTTVLFDNNYELLHDRINLRGIAPITNADYYVQGSTALLDAIGKTINKIAHVQQQTVEDERAEQVLFAITTDGMENASTEFTYEKVRQLIEQQQDKHGWKFIFLGANIDAIATAARCGIEKKFAVNYCADSKGVADSFGSVNEFACFMRRGREISEEWKERVDEDYKQRSGKS